MTRRATARVAAQAKVNLALRVHERDASGYHDLETIFARLDLADDVEVRVGGDARTIVCRGDWSEMVPAEHNIAFRAATMYAERAGWPEGFSIEIDKRIPMGGGLGGGSANAGAVLRALNALNPHPLDDASLLAIARALGADVPFLTADHAMALGTGRGDELRPLATLPEAEVRLIVPPFGVSTADAYRWLDESRSLSSPTWPASLDGASLHSWQDVAAVAINDFEPVVERRFAGIADALAVVRRAHADIVMLSGSGSTVFGVWFSRACQLAAGDVGAARVIATRTSARVVPVALLD
jgi:4-diphosphocytidyl-2-C-methyl-D-erythritol kinase